MTTNLPPAELPPDGIDPPRHLERVKVAYIIEALIRTRGQQKAAAALLRLSPRVLNYEIQRFDIQPLIALAKTAGRDEAHAREQMRAYVEQLCQRPGGVL